MGVKEYLETHINEYKRILIIAKKPSKEEYWDLAKISAIGLGLIGLIGFAIQILLQLLISIG